MTMIFSDEKPIWQQIYDMAGDRVLSGDFREGERVPSVREVAAEIGVNPNTVMRSYERLQMDGIFESRRGLGLFCSVGAREKILATRRENFFCEQLPALSERMKQLEIEPEQLVDELIKIRQQ